MRSTRCSTTRRTRRRTCGPSSSCFAGALSTSSSPAQPPCIGAATCSPILEHRSAATIQATRIRARPTAWAKSRCEDLLDAEHAAQPFSRIRRCAWATRSGRCRRSRRAIPIFFARLEAAAPDPDSSRRATRSCSSIHVARRRSAVWRAVDRDRARDSDETYTVTGRESATCERDDSPHGVAPLESKPNDPPRADGDRAARESAARALGRGADGQRLRSRSRRHSANSAWSPKFGLEEGYRDSYEWFVREGRSRYTFDFARDDALIAQLGGGTLHR